MSVLLNKEARAKISAGAEKLADTVKLTLGPKGRNIIISQNGNTFITNDGVTIARTVTSNDPYENLGVTILRQASQKTNEKAGDGTTSAIVFAAELLRHGNKQIELGASPILLKEGISAAAEFITEYVTKESKPTDSYEKLLAAAVNSAADKDDGKLAADAVAKVGADGIVTVEENTCGYSKLTFSEGLELPLEIASPYFCTSPQRLETVFENAKILIFPGVIKSVKELVTILEHTAAEKLNLVIIAEDFSADTVAALVLNRVRGGLNVMALRAAPLGERVNAILGDLASLTDAAIISSENDLTLSNARAEHLGTCGKIICNMSSTKIITPRTERLENRIEQIRGQINAANDEYKAARLRERLARLTNGIAVISVGRPTEIEQRERKLRIEDAVAAAKAAAREGTVEGGGVIYLRAAKELEKHIETLPQNLKDGAEVVLKSLDVILRQICINAAAAPDIIIHNVRNGKLGYDALNEKYTDMFDANIVDPAAVIKNIIINAASVVGTLLTTDGIIIDNDV